MKNSGEGNYTISSRESLHSLLLKNGKQYGRIVLNIEKMDEAKANKYENDLNKYHSSCGCSVGNYFLVTALVLYAACLVLVYQTIDWKLCVQGFFILLIAALLGKFVGKLMNGFKFKKTVEKLSHELTGPPA